MIRQLRTAPAQLPSIGRIVLYTLTSLDADRINGRRNYIDGNGGNRVSEGEAYPAVIVRVFGDAATAPCNLQVLLDGPDSYWATSRSQVDEAGPGSWTWPPMRALPLAEGQPAEAQISGD